jgi:hypothetical protein
MLLKFSEQITDCYRHAEECAQRATRERDRAFRDEWLTMERRWILVARGFELSESIERFQPRSLN